MRPVIKKTLLRPIFVMTALLTIIIKTPIATRMHEFWNAFPILAISKK